MSVSSYGVSLSDWRKYDSELLATPERLCVLLKAWRGGQLIQTRCDSCGRKLPFGRRRSGLVRRPQPPRRRLNYVVCCQRFYFRPTTTTVHRSATGRSYVPRAITVRTEGYTFALPQLQRTIEKRKIETDQQFLTLPDPIYWQVRSTLVYDKTMKFVAGKPMTKKTSFVFPPARSNLFYRQIQEAPLNHGSLYKRSGGKNTFFRQIAFGKRCVLSARAMIVPAADLRPNEIVLPRMIQDSFGVLGKWIILNRMPSLQPENFVALRVARVWDHPCFGIPLEIVREMNADFDGDECNLYILQNIQSQVECETILNAERNMGSFTLGLKLYPCQDMLVAYHMRRDEIDFLPYRNERASLQTVLQTVYDLYGSETTFESFDKMRRYYLHVLQDEVAFGISLSEMERLVTTAESVDDYEAFERIVSSSPSSSASSSSSSSSSYPSTAAAAATATGRLPPPPDGCLVTQVKAGAKGTFFHLYKMFGVDDGMSFWRGLTPEQAIRHAIAAYDGLLKSNNIWQPGYGYSKSVYNLQSLQVDHCGRLMDGEDVVLERDVLDALHHTDLMSEDAFSEILRSEMGGRQTAGEKNKQ